MEYSKRQIYNMMKRHAADLQRSVPGGVSPEAAAFEAAHDAIYEMMLDREEAQAAAAEKANLVKEVKDAVSPQKVLIKSEVKIKK